jgi:hypothetical protein
MVDWAALRETILRDRGPFCEICDIAPAVELHHCLWHRMRGRDELDSIFNLQFLCRECHIYANGFENRRRFWREQCKRYTREVMVNWYESLDLKIKENFE